MTTTSKVPAASGENLEIRVHGRGGQGGVTCAKLIAAVYAEMGLFVQTFGDYGSERSGAPVRAYTRVGKAPIASRNKVYTPDHLLVLDAALMGPDTMDGAAPGGVLLVNAGPGNALASDPATGPYRLATVDATAISRKHGIGTSSVVIINTTIIGAYAKALDLPLEAVEKAYDHLGLSGDVKAALEAYELVELREPVEDAQAPSAVPPLGPLKVVPLPEHVKDIPTPLKTGSWRSQIPCYIRHKAPCNISCPAGNDIVGFIQALREEGVEAAARILAETQPLPSVCGRVCPAFCMSSCNRIAYDGEVNIRGLERWIGDNVPTASFPAPLAARPRKVAVVGGGPAGLSAAYTLARKGHRVSLYEGAGVLGGVLRSGIPPYRLPKEPLERDLTRIVGLGIDVHLESPVDRDKLAELKESHEAVIVAAGLGSSRELDAPGADLLGAYEGLGFLAQTKAGELPELYGHVAVLGGGNTAIDCARSALRCGAEKVTIVYRRGRDEMPAIAEEIDGALEEGVALLVKRHPVEILGDERVEGLVLAHVELGPEDESGRRAPTVTDRHSRIRCDHVLWALGQSISKELLPVGWTSVGERVHDAEGPLPVWLAGDLADAGGTVTHAVGQARRIAEALLAELEGRSVPADEPPDPEEIVTPAHIRYTHFEVRAPHADRRVAAGRRLSGFDEVNLGLSGPEEASRCFSCGRCTQCDTCLIYCPEGIISRDADGYVFDESYCKGCGMCVAECPRQAMRMDADEAGG